MRAPRDGPLIVTNLFGSTKWDKPYVLQTATGPVAVKGHTGIDLDSAIGTPVLSVWPGWLERGVERDALGNLTGFGYYLVLHVPDGRSALYGHLSGYLLADGAKVGPGERIALSGSTGNSTGGHIHFEIKEAVWEIRNGYRGCRDPLGGFDPPIMDRFDMSLV